MKYTKQQNLELRKAVANFNKKRKRLEQKGVSPSLLPNKAWEYFQTVTVRKEPAFPSQCIGCGKCEKHCPQGIAIREELKNADRALRPLPYRIFGTAARLFVMGGRKEGTKARAGAGRKRSGRAKKH